MGTWLPLLRQSLTTRFGNSNGTYINEPINLSEKELAFYRKTERTIKDGVELWNERTEETKKLSNRCSN